MELFDIFSGTFGKEKAQLAVKDIETLISDHKRELATKEDVQKVKEDVQKVDLRLSEIELRLTKEIEQAKSSTIKWIIGWVAGFIVAQTAAIITMFTLLK